MARVDECAERCLAGRQIYSTFLSLFANPLCNAVMKCCRTSFNYTPNEVSFNFHFLFFHFLFGGSNKELKNRDQKHFLTIRFNSKKAGSDYLKNAAATPPSTFNVLPVDLFNNPPTKAKHALAISSGKIVSFSKVRFA